MANMCSMCGGSATPSKYQKQIDPPVTPYGSMMREEPLEEPRRKSNGGGMSSYQMCLPSGGNSIGSRNLFPKSEGLVPSAPQQPMIIQVPNEIPIQCPKFICEPCPPPPPTKIWLIKSSPTPQKAVCLPAPAPVKIMLCLPCPPPSGIQGGGPCMQGQTSQGNQQAAVVSTAFCVPQKCGDSEDSQQKHSNKGKYLPPPERRICSSNCIHVSDIKGSRTCTWHDQIPCVAHCFDTPLTKKG